MLSLIFKKSTQIWFALRRYFKIIKNILGADTRSERKLNHIWEGHSHYSEYKLRIRSI